MEYTFEDANERVLDYALLSLSATVASRTLSVVGVPDSSRPEAELEDHPFFDQVEDEEEFVGFLEFLGDSRPSVVGRYLDLFRLLVESPDTVVSIAAADAVLSYVESHPSEAAEDRVFEISAKLLYSEDDDEQVAGLRLFGVLGEVAPERVAAHDDRFAQLLSSEWPWVRQGVATHVGLLVADRPDLYPETVRALVDALDDVRDPESARTAATAAVVLGLAAETDPEAIPDADAERVLERVARLRDYPEVDDEQLGPALDRLRGATGAVAN